MDSERVENVPTKTGTLGGSAPARKMALTLAQKHALLDNLQLEVTERARRLRAQYNAQGQQLRSRVEMRVNRIPIALRKIKMGELLEKYAQSQQPRATRPPLFDRPPPVPAKDGTSPKPVPVPNASNRARKRLSNEISGYDDKENPAELGGTSKRLRGGTEAANIQPSQVLSPASTNLKVVPRGVQSQNSPTKSFIGRPKSPMKAMAAKAVSSRTVSNLVGKAKTTREKGTAKARTQKALTATASSSRVASAANVKEPAASTKTTGATTRGRRNASVISKSSETSRSTVIKKPAAPPKAPTKTVPAKAKRTVMSAIQSAAAKKAAANSSAVNTTAATGRTLRKR